MLDSGRPIATRGRYDLMSAWPWQNWRRCPTNRPTASSPAYAKRPEAWAPRCQRRTNCPSPAVCWAIYPDLGRRIERIGEHARDDLGLPLASVGLYAWALISDHQAGTSQLVFHPRLDERERQRLIALFSEEAQGTAGNFKLLGKFRRSISASDYRQAIRRIQDYIQAGDCYQVNYSQRFQAACSGSPWPAYRALREACPFSGYLRLADGAILSLSPERFLKLGRARWKPGRSRAPARAARRPRTWRWRRRCWPAQGPRGKPDDRRPAAQRHRTQLPTWQRTGTGAVCPESYPNVHHLVSSVTGELAPGKDALDLLEGSFPGGSITGAPKIRAMQIIDELEPSRRGIYCGSLFYLDVRGEMDARSPSAPCWSGTARSVAGAAAASSPTRTGRTSTRKPWTRSGCCWKPWKEWPGQRPGMKARVPRARHRHATLSERLEALRNSRLRSS